MTQIENPCRPRHFKPAPCAPLPIDEKTQKTLEAGRSRLFVVGGLFAAVFIVIGLRLVDVTLFRPEESRLAQARLTPRVVEVSRADIVDRNGTILATTLATPSLYANPKQITDPARVARSLAATFPDLLEGEVYAKLASDKSFVWVKRHLTPREQQAVLALGIPGLEFQREERRVYPHGALAAHVVGYTGIDNKGLAGIERSFDDALMQRKEPLQLSIDIRLQYILREEVGRSIEEYGAIGGAAIVMDVRNGEIVGLVSLPDFDPNRPGTATPERIFNRATLGAYEMGSTFKVFNTAMALDSGTSRLSSSYDATNPIRVGRFTINDYHAKRRWLTVPEIFMYSSNIGSAKMALEAGTERQKEFFRKIGFLRAPAIEIPEVAAPLVPSPWREVNTMTIAYGHGMSVTPMHLIDGTSAMVNGGILRQATIVKRPEGYLPTGQQVISARTSDEMRRLFRLVVEHGTGNFANAPGYVVGGKTGTAEKVLGKGYAHKALISSFISAFPMNEPRYAVLVMVDEPHGNKKSFGYATGGWVAAPAVGRIIPRIAPLLGVPPIDESAPDIRRAVAIDMPGLQVKKVASN
jgi:cell division protein FtsI (penicillin-binding protein 3)